MKTLLFICLSVFIFTKCFSQSLKGEWDGSFVDNTTNTTSEIKLYFSLKKDSAYNIYSYSNGTNGKGDDTVVVCSVAYKIYDEDSIYLEETKMLKPAIIPNRECLQRMFLKIRKGKKEITMDGNWDSSSKECPINGTISFIKKREKD